MKIIDYMKGYKSPKAKIVEVNVQSVLCESPSETDWDTEHVTHSRNSYGESDWE